MRKYGLVVCLAGGSNGLTLYSVYSWKLDSVAVSSCVTEILFRYLAGQAADSRGRTITIHKVLHVFRRIVTRPIVRK